MSFKLIEDFEALIENQSVSGQKSPGGQIWNTAGSSTVKDEFKVVTLENKKVLWCCPTYKNRAYLPLSTPLTSGHSGTLFFRIRYASADPIAYGVGLTTEAVPGDSRATLTMEYSHETGPLVSATFDSDKYLLKPNFWYKVWMVADLADPARSQTDNTFRVYYQNESEGGVVQMVDSAQNGKPAYTDFLFRKPASLDALRTFIIHAGYSAPFYIDDIYLDPVAENLTDAAATLALVNPYATDYAIVCTRPASGTSSAYEAALVLQEYIKKATWVVLPLVASPQQSGKNIYLVGSQADADAWRLSLNISNFPPEQYLVRVQDDSLILAGKDGAGDPWAVSNWYTRITTPTLHAVSRFLEDHIGAHWFWPVWTQEDVPEFNHQTQFGESYKNLVGKTLTVSRSLFVQDAPTSSLRDLELPYGPKAFESLGFSSTFAAKLTKGYQRWVRLNRLGGFDRVWVQHHWWSLIPRGEYMDGTWTSETDKTEVLSNGTWKNIKENDPADKLFAYLPDGNAMVRGGQEKAHRKKQGYYSTEHQRYQVYEYDHQLCVSGRKGTKDPDAGEDVPEILGLIQKAIETELKDSALRTVSIAPNDGLGHCQCEPCLKKDLGALASPPYNVPLSGNRNLGDRYFAFFNEIAKGVLTNPNLTDAQRPWITAFSYGDYIIPYELKMGTMKPLARNLIVYDTHNTNAFRFWDAYAPNSTSSPDISCEGLQDVNAKCETAYRIEKWSQQARDPNACKMAVFAEPYWKDQYFLPFYHAVTMASPEALTDLLGRMHFHQYSGGYFIFGFPQWIDMYLVAHLLWDARPLDNQTQATTISDYLAQLNARTAKIRQDYYDGLFGPASQKVRAFYERITAQLKAFIHDSTADQTASGGPPGTRFYDFWRAPEYEYKTLYQKVFAVIADAADADLEEAKSLAKEGTREFAHLEAVTKNWEFTKLTIDFFPKLDAYAAASKGTMTNWEADYSYSPDNLKAIRELGRVMVDRANLVKEVNDEVNRPDLCTLVLDPLTLSGDPSLGSAGQHTVTIKTASAISIKPANIYKKLITILTMLNDQAVEGWPVGIAPRATARREPSSIYLSWSDSSLWIDRFNRIDESVTKTYLVVFNQSHETKKGVQLTISNLDPCKTGRKLRYYRGAEIALTKGTAQCTQFSYSTDDKWPQDFDPTKPQFPQSFVTKDTATFDAAPGVTVLVLENANFAPYANVRAYLDSSVSDTSYIVPTPIFAFIGTSGVPVVESVPTIEWADLTRTGLRMDPVDDALLANNNAGGRFYFARFDEASGTFDPMSQQIPPVAAPATPHAKSKYREYIYSSYLNKIITKPGLYYIYGALYDKDGSKRMAATDQAGSLYCLKLRVKS